MQGKQLEMEITPKKSRHIIPISGKDSLATALVQTKLKPNIHYEFIFNDTGAELPEVYDWLNQVESKTGWKITRIGKNLEDVIMGFGGFLPSPSARYCTRESKIAPTDKFLGKDPAFVYYGLRADEDRIGYIPTGKSLIIPVYPLRDLNLGIAHVFAILEAHDLMPPSFFWSRLYDSVCEKLPRDKWISIEKWQERQLFSGRTRANCYFCPFQRRIEWLWLYETHYDFFERAKSFEKTDYTWIKDLPLSNYEDEHFREQMFNRYVNKIVGVLSGEGKATLDSEISRTSCGLICGK